MIRVKSVQVAQKNRCLGTEFCVVPNYLNEPTKKDFFRLVIILYVFVNAILVPKLLHMEITDFSVIKDLFPISIESFPRIDVRQIAADGQQRWLVAVIERRAIVKI